MSELASDSKGFTCECGTRNEYPDYVRDHEGVRLVYACRCQRQYVLFHGRVQKVAPRMPEYSESEAFGD